MYQHVRRRSAGAHQPRHPPPARAAAWRTIADRIELMNSLLLSMPGTPIIYYGDEIGMGDNIYLGDRNGVRTPMQWSPDRNAGFSRADPQRLYLPPIMDPIYGYQAVNVEAQTRDAVLAAELDAAHDRACASGRRRSAAARSRSCGPATARSSPTCASYGDEAILCVANLARSAQPVELDLVALQGPRAGRDARAARAFPPIGELPYLLTLPAHGFYWFRLAADAEPPRWHEERARRATTCRCWCCSTAGRACSAIASCPGASRWPRGRARSSSRTCCRASSRRSAGIAAKGEADRARAARRSPALGGTRAAAGCSRSSTIEGGHGAARRYFLPLAMAWEDADEEQMRALAPSRSPRSASRRASASWPTRSATRASAARWSTAIGRGGRDRLLRAARCASSPPARFAELGGSDAAAAGVHPARAQQQHDRDARRAAVPEGLSPRCGAASIPKWRSDAISRTSRNFRIAFRLPVSWSTWTPPTVPS